MKVRAARVCTKPADQPCESRLCYFDRDVGAQAAKVLPGEYLAMGCDSVLVTLLGSCVAVCLRDPVAQVGGMNHFMLPEGGDGIASDSARYGSYAMEMLTNELLKHGAVRERLEAKVFGGGNVLRGFTVNNIGEQNVHFAREYLRQEGIPVIAEDVLGSDARKVYYFPQTGRARVRHLGMHTHEDEVSRLERLYQTRLQQQPVQTGPVELFRSSEPERER